MDHRTYKPVSVAHPGETVTDYLASFGWSQGDLSRRTGLTAKTISEICNGKASISTNTSLAFEKVFGRPAHFWTNLQSKYDETTARVAEAEKSNSWMSWFRNFPIDELSERGWINFEKHSNQAGVIEVLKFLGVSSPDSWDNVWESSHAVYRQTRKHKINPYAASCWVRAVELHAERLDLGNFNESQLLKSLDKLRETTRLPIDTAFENVRELLSESGVAFVIEEAFPETGISGCTRWISSKKPIVAISLRYKSDDQIWFTLFHELGHVLLHRKLHSLILDNADESLTDGIVDPEMQQIEEEANRFAANLLIPSALLNKFVSFGVFTNDAIHSFAEAVGVAPGVVVGRLQHDGYLKPFQGNSLKQKVKISYPSNEVH